MRWFMVGEVARRLKLDDATLDDEGRRLAG